VAFVEQKSTLLKVLEIRDSFEKLKIVGEAKPEARAGRAGTYG